MLDLFELTNISEVRELPAISALLEEPQVRPPPVQQDAVYERVRKGVTMHGVGRNRAFRHRPPRTEMSVKDPISSLQHTAARLGVASADLTHYAMLYLYICPPLSSQDFLPLLRRASDCAETNVPLQAYACAALSDPGLVTHLEGDPAYVFDELSVSPAVSNSHAALEYSSRTMPSAWL